MRTEREGVTRGEQRFSSGSARGVWRGLAAPRLGTLRGMVAEAPAPALRGVGRAANAGEFWGGWGERACRGDLVRLVNSSLEL